MLTNQACSFTEREYHINTSYTINVSKTIANVPSRAEILSD
jgi:hypothetical protein